MRLVIALLVLALAGRAWSDSAKSEALAILDRAISASKDTKALDKALAELDALLVKNPRDADAHYARGWVLSRSGSKNSEAVAAYDRAFELDERLADAAYNAGVVLGRSGDTKGAIVRFERTLKINPKHVDAAYNAGQSYYDLGEFASAAQRWETAAKLSPDDFQIAKKLVQAYVALNKADKVKKARERVIAMWKSGKDPEVGKLKTYLFDQFAAGKYHVYVYEAFDISGDVVWQAKVALGNKVAGSINLEREKSAAFIVGIDWSDKSEHTTVPDQTWKKLPDYAAFKTLVNKTIETKF